MSPDTNAENSTRNASGLAGTESNGEITNPVKGNPVSILAIVTAVILLMNYVLSMMIPALPTIQKGLSTTATTAAWVTSGYVLVGAASATLLGKLGDVYGKKKMFLVSSLVFTLAIGLAGFSHSIYFLIAAMAIGGVGFALYPLGLAILSEAFAKEKLATAQGIIAGAAGIGSAAGLVLGSLIVQDLGWRSGFYAALPVSVILIVLSAKFLESSPNRVQTQVDYTGAFILVGGVALSLLYLSEGSTLGWLSLENLALLIPGLALTVGFFVFERNRSNPLIQLNLLRIRNVLTANLVTVMSGLSNFLLFIAFVYYAEYPKPFGLGLDVLSTGLAFVPATIILLVVGPVSGKMMTKKGPKPVLLVGSLILACGLVFLMSDRSSTVMLSIGTAISMAGIIALFVPVVNMVSVSLPKGSISTGLGINSMLKSLGQAIGPVLVTSVMSSYTVPLTEVINGKTVVVAKLASATAFNYIFAIGMAVTVVIALVSLFVKNYTFNKTVTEQRIHDNTVHQG